MGLAGMVKGLFSSVSDDQREEIQKEISFADALTAHVAWKTRLASIVAGTSKEVLDPAMVKRDDQCLLGKWIHGPGKERLGKVPEFQELKSEHAHFHVCACTVLEHSIAGDKAKADAALKADYAKAANSVIFRLTALSSKFK